MNKKQIFTISIAVILVMLISVAGTLAYLTAKQDGDKAVVNTFVAKGNGNIIDPDGPEPPIDDLMKGFFLVESTATYDEDALTYTLADPKVLKNTYDKVALNTTIAKDPALTVNVEDGADAYVFIKVTNSLNDLLTFELTSDWVAVTGAANVYAYKTIVSGTTADAVELNAVQILKDNVVTVADATSFGELENGALGELKFEAYACQADGFADAAAAWTACFGN